MGFFENPFKNRNKKEVLGAAGLAAVVAGGGAALEVQMGSDALQKGLEMKKVERAQMERQVAPQEMEQTQEKGPEGATIQMNQEGPAVVNIPAPAEREPVTVDMTSRTVEMAPPGMRGPVTIDLHTEPTTIDLSSREVVIDAKKINPDNLGK